MRWRARVARLVRDLSWACLIVALAAYGAAVVRNVTDALGGITSRQPDVIVAKWPSR
jgi:F0F1-type ATP synthase membrane subunit c/vacuolar-type H+-ATPase subunit K